MSRNPYLDDLAENYVPEDFDVRSLGILAVAHELRELNRLTAEAAAPMRIVSNIQAPVAPEDFLRSQKIMTSPDDSEGDARIAAAARRWAEAYGARNVPGKAAAHHLASNELLEAVRQEDER